MPVSGKKFEEWLNTNEFVIQLSEFPDDCVVAATKGASQIKISLKNVLQQIIGDDEVIIKDGVSSQKVNNVLEFFRYCGLAAKTVIKTASILVVPLSFIWATRPQKQFLVFCQP